MTTSKSKKPARRQRKSVVDQPINSAADFEKLLLNQKNEIQDYVLRLYITGITPRSTEAVCNIRTLCEEHLKGHYQLEIVDIYQQPDQAFVEQIIAAPTLIRKFPTPPRRIIGNLSDPDKIILGLELQITGSQPAKSSTPTHWIKV